MNWIAFWIGFGAISGIESFFADDVLREYFDVTVCLLCIMMARIEYMYLKLRSNRP